MSHPARLQLSRAKGSRLPANAVRCDRATALGNPWAAGDPGALRLMVETVSGRGARWSACPPLPRAITQQDAVAAHAAWLRDGTLLLPDNLSPSGEFMIRDDLLDLRDQVLGRLKLLSGRSFACWCKPGSPCHADTLMRFANA